jgi:LacI family transcriptional regulator
MSTIFDIAKKADVSVMTVSRVFNNPEIVSDKTIQKVHKIMDDLGYQPSHIARSLVKKQTNTIGVIMPDIKNTFFNSWFRYVEDYATSHNYNLLLCNTDEDPLKEMNYIKLLHSQRVDGILIAPHAHKSIEYLQKSGIPFVSVDRVFVDLNTDYVTTDHYSGALNAVEYLIKKGHKKILILKGPGIIFPDKQRYSGSIDAMKKYKLKPHADLFLNCEFDEQKACKAVKDIFKSINKPTAIFSFNSIMMIGAIKALNALNKKIPYDVSLICFDEIPGYEIFQPAIACISQPVSRLGTESIKILIGKIKHPELRPKGVLLKPELIPGNSIKRMKINKLRNF